MNRKLTIIAMTLIFAIVTATFASIKPTKTFSHSDPSIATHQQTAEAHPEAQPRVLVPDRSRFRPTTIFRAIAPSFGRAIRRAALRRKGRIQH